MFACISGQGGALGSGGCFTAGCDLLGARGSRSLKDRVAQQFLVLMLNRCAGLICDDQAVSCTEDADEDGDDGIDLGDVHTVGDVIGLVNDRLCSGDVTNAQLDELKDVIECAMGSEGEDEDEGEDDARLTPSNQQVARGGLVVRTLGGNPLRAGIEARIQLQSTQPVMVEFGIYDAQGRLVARLLRNVAVAGSMEVRWNGRNVQGERVPPGTYFYRATAANTVASGRIVVLK
jgi:hypothetical protein